MLRSTQATRSSAFFAFFCLRNRILLREAEPSLHMVSGLGHIESEWERQCRFTLLPSIAEGQWERDRREARPPWKHRGDTDRALKRTGIRQKPAPANVKVSGSLSGGKGSWSVTVDRKLCGARSVFMLQNKLLQCRAVLVTRAKRRSASWDVKQTSD